MTDIFLKILNMSISASFLVLAVLILRIVLKNAPKWIRVVLWGIVAVRLVCPSFIESEISLIPQKEYVTKSDIEFENSSMNDFHISTNDSFSENISMVDSSKDDYLFGDISQDYTFSGNDDTISGNSSMNEESNSMGDLSKESVSIENSFLGHISGDSENSKSEIIKNPPVSEKQNNNLLSIVAIIWDFGMGLMVLYFVLSYVKLYNKVKTAVRLKDNIFQSENVYSPFILGFFNPKIYIPFNMPEKEMNFVLSHEKSHLRRKDHWWKPLGYLLLMVHWFNPFIWVSYILLCKDIELASDEKVVKNFSVEQKADYAKALLLCSVGKRNVLTCPVSFGETDIKGRVASVLKHKKPAVWIIAIGVVSCALLVAFFLTDPREETESSAEESNLSENSNNVSEIEASENTSDESTAEENPIEIKIKYNGFDDSELDFTDSDDSEPYQITVNQTIEKFKFFRVFYDENGKPYECGTLYGTELLTPDDAFSVRTNIRTKYSNRGISYKNKYGKECFFLISYEKGLPVLIPFENESKKETEINVNVFYVDSWQNRTISFDGTISGMIEAVFPKGISVNYFYIENGIAHIDLNRDYSDYLSVVGNKYCVGLVVNSLLEYYGEYGVQRVLITVDDSKEIRFENELFLGKLGSNNDSSDDGKHYALLTLIDINALKDYYYPIVFDGTIDGLISKLSEVCGWGNEIKVNHFEIKDNVAYIDFNEAFGDGVDVVSPEDTRFYCVYDAIQSYYNVDDVKITMSESEKIPAIPEDKEV
ncbi:MAG: M56 family metallopeptidase, partial [Clostridia bacterium]|nr:M56 family metallopeptidase [Clostridia bacterium]